MAFRDLPPFRDLRAFVRFLEERSDLARIREPVSLVHEMTEIHRRTLVAGGPALWFDKAHDQRGPAQMPVLANLFGTADRVAAGFGVEPRAFANSEKCWPPCASPRRSMA